MKYLVYKRKTKLFALIYSIILILSCVIIFNKHDIVFADTTSIANNLNTISINEIAQREKYNSCDYNIVTQNLDQGSTNICWAYATASASETSILKDKLDNNTKDTLRFSPVQIAYRTHNRDKDPLNNTNGVYANDKWNVTGSSYNTFLMLSQWCAPVSGDVSAKVDAYANNLYRLLDAEQIDLYSTGSYRINEIKRAIAKYGAVTGSYYNAREVYYYNTKGEPRDGISHAMTIVGWDDTIPASNFQPKVASQNGGWIIKNSYNSLPYFYLSYDSSVGNVCGFKYANKSEFDFNYFYDNVLDAPMRSESNSKCVSNVFIAKKGDKKHNEYVKAVNVATYGYNLTCKVKVYTNLTDHDNPESGVLSATGERVLDYGGYHTIMLDNLTKIENGTYYSVVVNISSNTGGSAYILYSLNTSGNTHYKSSNGWNSIGYAGRIKAYTVLQEKIEPEQKIDISFAQHNGISPITFTGQAICPQVNLTLNSQNLIKDVDYTISYKNNTNAGTAEIKINGIEKYTGSLTLEFEILPIDVPIKPNSEIKISSNITTLTEISLPAGWQWQNPNLLVDNLTSATAIYVGENKDNYKNTTMTISLQKEESTNPNPDNPKPDNPNDNDNNNQNQPKKDNENISTGTIVIIIISCSMVIIVGTFIIFGIWFKKKSYKKLVSKIKENMKKEK